MKFRKAGCVVLIVLVSILVTSCGNKYRESEEQKNFYGMYDVKEEAVSLADRIEDLDNSKQKEDVLSRKYDLEDAIRWVNDYLNSERGADKSLAMDGIYYLEVYVNDITELLKADISNIMDAKVGVDSALERIENIAPGNYTRSEVEKLRKVK